MDFGNLLRIFKMLWSQQRWWRVLGNASAIAFRNLRAAYPTVATGAMANPRALISMSNSRPVDRQGIACKPREGALRAFGGAQMEARQLLPALRVRADRLQAESD